MALGYCTDVGTLGEVVKHREDDRIALLRAYLDRKPLIGIGHLISRDRIVLHH